MQHCLWFYLLLKAYFSTEYGVQSVQVRFQLWD